MFITTHKQSLGQGKLIMVAEWLAYLTAIQEVSQSNPASYLCWNMHVRKWPAAMLAIKRLVGAASEVNLRKCISHTPPPNVNKADHSGFETQRRCNQKSKTSFCSQGGIDFPACITGHMTSLQGICIQISLPQDGSASKGIGKTPSPEPEKREVRILL